jgi:hypothetical protein
MNSFEAADYLISKGFSTHRNKDPEFPYDYIVCKGDFRVALENIDKLIEFAQAVKAVAM